jgi:hypothetical protein
MEDSIMKKLIVLILVFLACLSGNAANPGKSWIVTSAGKIDCEKLKVGLKTAHLVFENGSKKEISINTIDSYSLNGKVFTKLPLYKNGKPTDQKVFMELIKIQNDLNLYKYDYSNYVKFDQPGKLYSYFLYDNSSKLIMELEVK